MLNIQNKMKKFTITTAIDYANGAPHLGHTYEKLLADAIARNKRLSGDDLFFMTGTDEHGEKVLNKSASMGEDVFSYCDGVSAGFRALSDKMNISYDRFLRTTEDAHKTVVRKVLQDLWGKDLIYKSSYVGYYSEKTEQFLLEKDKVGGEWPKEFGEITEVQEENYFFSTSKYQEWLISYIEENVSFILPRFRVSQVLNFLKGNKLNDLCISRPKSRLSWGIELPFDEEYVTYVWFDALLSYVSALDYGSDRFDDLWPVDVQVIGKDILLPSHSIYWPIMLKAMGLDMPKTILVHGWWTKGGQKMSKSEGDTIDPYPLIARYGVDAVRYYLLRDINVGQDSEFTEERMHDIYDSELCNIYGNLMNRIVQMVRRYFDAIVPEFGEYDEKQASLIEQYDVTYRQCLERYDAFDFSKALILIRDFLKRLNGFLEERKPWAMIKEGDEQKKTVALDFALISEMLLRVAALYFPVMPEVFGRVASIFALETSPETALGVFSGGLVSGCVVAEDGTLFNKLSNVVQL